MKLIKIVLYSTISIVVLKIFLLNQWGHDPIFNFAVSMSWANKQFFHNDVTFYFQEYYFPYLYGVFGFLLIVPGYGFLPMKLLQIFGLLIIVFLSSKIIRKNSKLKKIDLLVFITMIFSNSVIIGPRLEVFPIILMLVIIIAFEYDQDIPYMILTLLSLIVAMLGTLHPMAVIQGLIVLGYLAQKKLDLKKIIFVIVLSFLIFSVLIGFNYSDFIDPYINGPHSEELSNHSPNVILLFKYLLLNILTLTFFPYVLKSRLKYYLTLSVIISLLFGRSYYFTYMNVWIVLLLKSFNGDDHKNKIGFLKTVCFMNLFIVLIPVLQAIENKSYYINLYKYEKELHIKTRNLSDTNNLWVNYRLLPAMYDRENIRFYWALSKLNNIENFVQNGDLFVVNDKEELNLVKDIGTKKNMKITEIYNSSLVSEGLLRINGRRTDSLKFEIYKIDESNK